MVAQNRELHAHDLLHRCVQRPYPPRKNHQKPWRTDSLNLEYGCQRKERCAQQVKEIQPTFFSRLEKKDIFCVSWPNKKDGRSVLIVLAKTFDRLSISSFPLKLDVRNREGVNSVPNGWTWLKSSQNCLNGKVNWRLNNDPEIVELWKIQDQPTMKSCNN